MGIGRVKCLMWPQPVLMGSGKVVRDLPWIPRTIRQKLDDDCHRCQSHPREAVVMKAKTVTTDQPENHFESTHALLIRSAEKGRDIFEMLIHPLLLLGPIVAIWQFAQQPITRPAAGSGRADCLVCYKQSGVGKAPAPTLGRRTALKG